MRTWANARAAEVPSAHGLSPGKRMRRSSAAGRLSAFFGGQAPRRGFRAIRGSGKRGLADCSLTAVRFTKRPLPWSRVGSKGAIHRAVCHLSPQGQTPNAYLTPAHPPTHRACPRDMVARGHLAPRPATQEATCNGARASSRAFQQTMGWVFSDVMVKHQPVRPGFALISATVVAVDNRSSGLFFDVAQ